jgi:hypothetical protein
MNSFSYVNYSDILSEVISTSKNKNISKIDNDYLAYHYAWLGFPERALHYLNKLNVSEELKINQKISIDSEYYIDNFYHDLINHDYSRIPSIECEMPDNLSELEILFLPEELDTGLLINCLPYIETFKTIFNIKKIKIDTSDYYDSFFKKYFDYIETGNNDKNKIYFYQILEFLHVNNVSIEESLKEISNRFKSTKKYIGIFWYSNNLFDKNKSLPIGIFINTTGNYANVKSLQYNYPDVEIELYNKYSKYEIEEVFNSDYNTSLLDIIEGMLDCKCYVGVSGVFAHIASSLLNIPTLILTGAPNTYWFWIYSEKQNTKLSRMRFIGDYATINYDIDEFLKKTN